MIILKAITTKYSFFSKGGHLHHTVVSVGKQVHDTIGGGC